MSDDDSDNYEEGWTDAKMMEWHQSRRDQDILWEHGFERYGNTSEDHETDFESIQNPRPGITKLFTTENWQRMGEHIHDSAGTDLPCKDVNLSDCGLTAEHVEALFGGERPCMCPIKYLNLSHNQLGPRGLQAVLQNASRSMYALNLEGCNLRAEGARLLAAGLSEVRIERLYIDNCGVDDEGIVLLLSATNSVFLEELFIQNNSAIGRVGIDALATFLERDDTALKKLVLQYHRDDRASYLVDSISRKSKLEELLFWNAIENRTVLPPVALRSLQKLVCDATSLESIIESNHVLKNVGDEPLRTSPGTSYNDDSQYIAFKALRVNRRAEYGTSTNQIIRSKIRQFYFQFGVWSEKTYDVQPFVDFDVALMPHLLELVTRTESTLDGKKYVAQCDGNIASVHRLIKNCQTAALFSFHSQPTKMQQLEAEVAQLREKNDELNSTIDELRKQMAELDLPHKRAKK